MTTEEPSMRAFFDQHPDYYTGRPLRSVARCMVKDCFGPMLVCHIVDRTTLQQTFYCQCHDYRIIPVDGLSTEQEAVQAMDVLLAMTR